MSDQTVKVPVDHRGDGKATVTVKLVGWSYRELRNLSGSLWLQPDSRRIGRALTERLDQDTPTGRRQ